MSKNVKSVALSIAGIMIAAPAGAEIASTDYVDRIIGETHIQGSVLQFDKLTDDPTFVLGATGTGVSNYGAVSIAELGLTLGSQIAGSAITGFATGSGSFVLVGDGTTSGSAGWSSVTEMLRNGLDNPPSTDASSVPVHYNGKNRILYRTPKDFVADMVPGSLISGYGTGRGAYVLVGDGTTTGSAKWQGMSTMGPSIAGYGTGTGSFVLVGNGTTTGGAGYMGASNLSQYMRGSAISGYNTVTGQPSYILGSSASGTGAKPALYPMSGLGSKIEFTETKTAAQLSASTGTIYFPVIQDGKIYGVTLNDFYILMNAQF